MCHLWHNTICDAAASGNFHMHVHMLLYTEKIRGGFSCWSRGFQCRYCTKHCDEGYWETLFDFIRGKKIRWKSWSQRTLSSASGKLTDIMLFDLQPKPNSWLAINVLYKQSVWLNDIPLIDKENKKWNIEWQKTSMAQYLMCMCGVMLSKAIFLWPMTACVIWPA